MVWEASPRPVAQVSLKFRSQLAVPKRSGGPLLGTVQAAVRTLALQGSSPRAHCLGFHIRLLLCIFRAFNVENTVSKAQFFVL